MEIKVTSGAESAKRGCNLEQLRALTAFAWRNKIRKASGGGDARAVAKKVPTQIIQNGFLGALAFAIPRTTSGTSAKVSSHMIFH